MMFLMMLPLICLATKVRQSKRIIDLRVEAGIYENVDFKLNKWNRVVSTLEKPDLVKFAEELQTDDKWTRKRIETVEDHTRFNIPLDGDYELFTTGNEQYYMKKVLTQHVIKAKDFHDKDPEKILREFLVNALEKQTPVDAAMRHTIRLKSRKIVEHLVEHEFTIYELEFNKVESRKGNGKWTESEDLLRDLLRKDYHGNLPWSRFREEGTLKCTEEGEYLYIKNDKRYCEYKFRFSSEYKFNAEITRDFLMELCNANTCARGSRAERLQKREVEMKEAAIRQKRAAEIAQQQAQAQKQEAQRMLAAMDDDKAAKFLAFMKQMEKK